jgi:hypothetical protein
MNADNPRGTVQTATESQKALVGDLGFLGLRTRAGQRRNRRGHDMRRTFITLARTDGAIDGLLRWVTHGPSSEVIDVYTSPPWAALCAEISKLKIALNEGALVSLRPPTDCKRCPASNASSTDCPPVAHRRSEHADPASKLLPLLRKLKRPRRDSNPNFAEEKPITIRGPAILSAGYGGR